MGKYLGMHRKGKGEPRETASRVLYTAPLCPECKGFVMYRTSCATFIEDDKWVFCEGCNSAVQYLCTSHGECPWFYIHGLDKENPHSMENELRRPSWISPNRPVTDDGVHVWIAPGVPSAG